MKGAVLQDAGYRVYIHCHTETTACSHTLMGLVASLQLGSVPKWLAGLGSEINTLQDEVCIN